MVTLLSTKVALRLASYNQTTSFFYATDPDLPGYVRSLGIDNALWIELGTPSVITVTIEPGDRLNG